MAVVLIGVPSPCSFLQRSQASQQVAHTIDVTDHLDRLLSTFQDAETGQRGYLLTGDFSDHSLATDSVFAEVQLVSCRNVLIYFDRPLQDRALGLLRESLCRRGFLGLGSKESLRFSTHAAAFREVVADRRIYQKL